MADHVFISYAREDQGFVLQLASRLRECRVPVWIDQWNIGPGEIWQRAIDDAVYECAFCLVVLSPASVRSNEVLAEYSLALGEGKTVVPVLYQSCRVPYRLRPLQQVDYSGRGAEDEDLLREMLDALGAQARATPQVEAPPVADERQCPACGAKVLPDQAFCAACGTALDPTADPAAAVEPVATTVVPAAPEPRVPAAQPRDPGLEAALSRLRLPAKEWVRIPAGAFTMGSPEGEGAEYEHPQHELTLPEYYIMRTPVTNAHYARFVEAGGYRQREWWTEAGWAALKKAGRTTPRYATYKKWNQPAHPVVGVSWYEALAFARWAGGTLPSEAEWEKAAGWDARAGRARRYPWGDEWDAGRCNTKEEGPGRTTPVGQYSPRGDSAYGLADLAGEVREWTRSRWGDDMFAAPGFTYRYEPGDGREDLEGADARVLRGGGWSSANGDARCAFRGRGPPVIWLDNVGFRACFSLVGSGS